MSAAVAPRSEVDDSRSWRVMSASSATRLAVVRSRTARNWPMRPSIPSTVILVMALTGSSPGAGRGRRLRVAA